MGTSLLALAKSIYQNFVKLRTTEEKHPKYTQRKAFPKKIPVKAEIRFTTKATVTSLSRNIYFDRPKNNIIIKLIVCVIHIL